MHAEQILIKLSAISYSENSFSVETNSNSGDDPQKHQIENRNKKLFIYFSKVYLFSCEAARKLSFAFPRVPRFIDFPHFVSWRYFFLCFRRGAWAQSGWVAWAPSRSERHNMQLNLHNFFFLECPGSFCRLVLRWSFQQVNEREKQKEQIFRLMAPEAKAERMVKEKKFLLLAFWAVFLVISHSNYLCGVAWFFNYSCIGKEQKFSIIFSLPTKSISKEKSKKRTVALLLLLILRLFLRTFCYWNHFSAYINSRLCFLFVPPT